MKKHVSFLAALALLLLLGGYILAMSSPGFQINWMMPLSGGGGPSGSASYAAHVTVGQTVIGQATSNNYKTALGFWQDADQLYEVYLPFADK